LSFTMSRAEASASFGWIFDFRGDSCRLSVQLVLLAEIKAVSDSSSSNYVLF